MRKCRRSGRSAETQRGRYSDRRAEWAAGWLEQVDSGEERRHQGCGKEQSHCDRPATPSPYLRLALAAIAVSVLVAIALAFLNFG